MKNKSALIITSAQHDLLHPQGGAWPLVESTVKPRAVVEHLSRLLAAARRERIPVFHSPVVIDYGNPSLQAMEPPSAIHRLILKNKLLGKGTLGAQFLTELSPLAGEGILPGRTGFSSFWNSDLDEQLRAKGIRQVFLAGMLAHACIESHARDAVEKGYQPVIARDAIGAAGDALLEASLKILELHAHEITDTATITQRWATCN